MLVATHISRKTEVEPVKQEGMIRIFVITSSASKCKRECTQRSSLITSRVVGKAVNVVVVFGIDPCRLRRAFINRPSFV